MRANYGIDAPGVVRGLGIAGVVSVAVAGWTYFGGPHGFRFLQWPGLCWLATALWMVIGSKVIKLRVRDGLLSAAGLRADERVLDVGCGRGLLLIGAAKLLPNGQATGLDLWRTKDQSGNDPAVTTSNAAAEGVADRITLETGDMTKMTFADASFDVVVSSWAIHNVPSEEGRAATLRECARVLKPGGRLAIVDIGPGRKYGDVLEAAGLEEVRTSLSDLAFLIPSWRTTARRA